MKSSETWQYIHAERGHLAETLSTLTPDQWSSPSWCEAWNVRQVAGHVLAAAEQTIPNFYKTFMAAGFKFNVFADNDAKRLGALDTTELINRLRARTTTTNHPPAPIVTMLGEIVVHGDDIRRPLGLTHRVPEAALIAVANNFKRSNLLLGSKRRIEGVELRATDSDWSHGVGPLVAGPCNRSSWP